MKETEKAKGRDAAPNDAAIVLARALIQQERSVGNSEKGRSWMNRSRQSLHGDFSKTDRAKTNVKEKSAAAMALLSEGKGSIQNVAQRFEAIETLRGLLNPEEK